MKILLVEDDPIQRVALKSILEKNNTVWDKERPSDALGLKPDLAILDLMIEGDMSGIAFAKTLRHKSPETKIVIYTALTKGKHWRDAVEIADHVIEKRDGILSIEEALGRVIDGL